MRAPGEVIGEIALLENTTRNATGRALTDSLLLAIGQEQLDLLLTTSPSAARTMIVCALLWFALNFLFSWIASPHLGKALLFVTGFAQSFSRPGGNVTGFTNIEASLGGKAQQEPDV